MTSHQQTLIRPGLIRPLVLAVGMCLMAAGCSCLPGGQTEPWQTSLSRQEEPNPVQTPQDWVGLPRPEM